MSAKPNHKRNATLFIITTTIIMLLSTWLLNSYDLSAATRSAGPPPTDAEEESSYVPPLSEQYYNILLLGVDNDGMADVIVLVSVNFFSDLIVITTISRDTYVENHNWSEEGQGTSHLSFASYVGMDAARKDYKSGAANTAYWVEELFGLEIHDYALITHDGFIELIDLIGGVEIDVNPAFEGKRLDSFGKPVAPLPTGLQRLNGEQAFVFSRFRGGSEAARIAEPGSSHDDGDRMIRNQQLLKAIYKQIRTLNTGQILNTIRQAPEFVHTSINLWDLTTMVPKLQKMEFNEIITLVIPGEFAPVYEEQAGKNVYYYLVDYEMAAALLSGLGLIWDENE